MKKWLLIGFCGFFLALPVSASCVLHQVTTWVCSLGECEETVHITWVCTGGGGGGTGGGNGGSGGGGCGCSSPPANPSDIDNDGYLDSWDDVLETTDPCANNFDRNDRLGTNYGGPNTTRPDHRGVDIQANNGDRVNAIADGQIAAVAWHNEDNPNGGCGFWVILNHTDGSVSTYCHLNAFDENPEVGDHVQAGSQIGTADSTGNSTGDHLHLVYADDEGNREEYFNHTGNAPNANQLNPNGC